MSHTHPFSIDSLRRVYESTFARSHELFCSGRKYFPNGVSQYGRHYHPFPVYIEGAQGAELYTADGKTLIDFWQGHFANIFGHNPAYLKRTFEVADSKLLLHLGCNTALEQEVAAELCKLTGTEQAIFCSTGAQATMLATLIGLAHTRRKLVLKIEGGWHGVQPWSLVAVKSPRRTLTDAIECAGLPSEFTDQVVTVPFNDTDFLNDTFKSIGPEIGVIIAELVLGNAGMEMATTEFVRALRENCDRFSSVLIFDEIVTGFRCNPGPLSALYGIRPDLATFGKAIAGGMPFSAIVAAKEFFATVRAEGLLRVVADAGTFTSHPATLIAVLATLREITARAEPLYTGIARLASELRHGLDGMFHKRGVPIHVTGCSPDVTLPDFPVMTVRFLRDSALYDQGITLSHWDNSLVDIQLRDELSRLALCLRGVFPWQGAGVITGAHSPSHIQAFLAAYDEWISTWSIMQ